MGLTKGFYPYSPPCTRLTQPCLSFPTAAASHGMVEAHLYHNPAALPRHRAMCRELISPTRGVDVFILRHGWGGNTGKYPSSCSLPPSRT